MNKKYLIEYDFHVWLLESKDKINWKGHCLEIIHQRYAEWKGWA